jgi:hypothetical protein
LSSSDLRGNVQGYQLVQVRKIASMFRLRIPRFVFKQTLADLLNLLFEFHVCSDTLVGINKAHRCKCLGLAMWISRWRWWW